MTIAPPSLSPLNDFAVQVYIEALNPTTGVIGPLIGGSVQAFLATTNDPAVASALPAWVVSGVYIGGANNYPDGTWQFEWDGSILTITDCDTAFLALLKGYVIIQRAGSIRRALSFLYKRVFVATVTA